MNQNIYIIETTEIYYFQDYLKMTQILYTKEKRIAIYHHIVTRTNYQIR